MKVLQYTSVLVDSVYEGTKSLYPGVNTEIPLVQTHFNLQAEDGLTGIFLI